MVAAIVGQVSDPRLSCEKFLDATPALDTSGNRFETVWISGTIGAGHPASLKFHAEYFKKSCKLVVYDPSDMTPLAVSDGVSMLQFDLINRRFVFAPEAFCVITADRHLENGKGRFEFDAKYILKAPVPNEARFNLNVRSLLYNRQSWRFTDVNDRMCVLRQAGEAGSMLQVNIDFSRVFIVKSMRLLLADGSVALEFEDIQVNYKNERTVVPELSKQVHALPKELNVLNVKSEGAKSLFLSGETLLRSRLARATTQMPSGEGRDEILRALSLDEGGLEEISKFDSKYAHRMRPLVEEGKSQEKGTNQENGR